MNLRTVPVKALLIRSGWKGCEIQGDNQEMVSKSIVIVDSNKLIVIVNSNSQ